MPSFAASFGPWMCTSSPSKKACPLSQPWMPAMHLMSVDLPAPLSPTRAITSPARTSKSTSASACTEPKDLVRPRSSRSGVDPVTDGFLAEIDGGAQSQYPDRAPPSSVDFYLQYCAYVPTHTSLFFR